MTIILKGQNPEITVPVTARFSKTDTDSFSVVVKRGNDEAYQEFITRQQSKDALSDRELCDEYIIRLEGLTDINGAFINGNGVLAWVDAEDQRKAEKMTENYAETLQVIDAMMNLSAYKVALIGAIYAGQGNAELYQAGRLGNLTR